MSKKLIIALTFILVIFAGYKLLSSSKISEKNTSRQSSKETQNISQTTQVVREENGRQIIHILAKGGYSPKSVTAKSGVPTTIEMETKGTYDCSSAFTIPSLKYQKQLPPSGITTVDIDPQTRGSELLGTCSMGMYSFTVKFE